MSDEKIFMTETGDPKMDEAIKNARETFKYFWREMSWEERRIVKAHNLNAVKVAFETDSEDAPDMEHMWINQLAFDGVNIAGVLLNQPQWVSDLNSGDDVIVPFEMVTDWMYAVNGKVYGAYTVNAMRADMEESERDAHDSAWGLDFGPPEEIELFYKDKPERSLKNLFKKASVKSDEEMMALEHPMSINMEPTYREQLSQSNDIIEYRDPMGSSLLHKDALAGNMLIVRALLDNGADKEIKNANGHTALDLAMKMKWPNIISLLQ